MGARNSTSVAPKQAYPLTIFVRRITKFNSSKPPSLVETEAPQSNPSCPTTPTNAHLPGGLGLGLEWRFGSPKFSFYSAEASAPAGDSRKADNEEFDFSKPTSLVRTKAPQSNPGCLTTPTNAHLSSGLGLALGWRFGSPKFDFCSAEASVPANGFCRADNEIEF